MVANCGSFISLLESRRSDEVEVFVHDILRSMRASPMMLLPWDLRCFFRGRYDLYRSPCLLA
jgi:hypothetical protein